MYIGEIFNKSFNFPIENRLSIIIGMNGTGKTLALRKLKEYFEQNNENVVYFPEPEKRILYGDPQEIKTILHNNFDLELLNPENTIKNNFNMAYLNYAIDNIENYLNDYIDSGYIQIINFLYHILRAEKESIILIDTPETNFDIIVQHNLLDYILSLCTVKKLIVCTHSPSIINNNWDSSIVEIENCIKLY